MEEIKAGDTVYHKNDTRPLTVVHDVPNKQDESLRYWKCSWMKDAARHEADFAETELTKIKPTTPTSSVSHSFKRL